MRKRIGSSRRRSATLSDHLLCGASLSAIVLLGLPSVAHAQDQDRYWDANSTGTGSGGNGDWNTADPVWSESNSDVLGPYHLWDNSALDNAIFGITAPGTTTTVGTVNLTEPIIVHNMRFQTVNNWVISGNTLTLGGTTPTINTIGHATINSVIAGTSGLTKTGNAQLFLTGANTFSGGITLSGGTLRAASDAALGNASNNIFTTANASFILDTGSTSRTVTIDDSTTLSVSGAGTGSALYTGSGNISVFSGVRLTNDANTYTGTTRLNGVGQGSGSVFFSSVRNLGEASSLGAPTTVANGTITFAGGSQYSDNIIYTGDGDSSNRNWVLAGGPQRVFRQRGTGTLTLTGDISVTPTSFIAETADFELLGVISGSGSVGFGASAAGSITLGGANTFTGNAGVSGGIVRAPVLADAGLASSLGTASTISLGNLGQLSYTGIGGGSNRTWSSDGATSVLNDGTGALNLSGNLAFIAGGTDTLTLGGSFAGTNSFSGVVSGNGNLASSGSGTWVLDGVNTRTGTVTMNGGTLRAGNASALGTTTGVTINAGTLDLNGFDLALPALNGTGGTLALGNAILTLDTTTANSFAGSITGSGSLTKLGTGVLTLAGASTYSGDTNIQGGTLALNFAPAGGPVSDIIDAASTLNMSGGTLRLAGAAGEANTQTFDGLNITVGANTIGGTSGSGGSLDVHFGAITRTGGIVNFNLPTSGNFTTSNTSLGGWATVNGTDYAKVVGGSILAFTDADYTDKDDASTWANGEFISDSDGDAESYFGTVGSSIQLGGLQFTTPDATATVAIADGQTLGVDGTIIIAPSVLANNQTITGGNLTGLSGAGGVLGVLHNGTGTLTVSSTIVDNGGATGFTKGGQGTVSLTGASTYTGATMLSNGRLIVNSIGDGGAASAIGASSAAPASLVLEGGILQYTGDTVTTDRGFTLVNGGLSRTIEIASGAANLTFTGLVTSPDDAGLIKTGGGTLTLANAANDYVGVTRVEDGILSVGTLAEGGQVSGIGAATSDSTNLVLLNGGTLQYTGGSVDIDRGFTIENGAGRIDVSAMATELTVGGAIAGAGRLEKYGDGTLVLAGTSSYTGITVVNAGTLRAGAALAGGSTTGVFGTVSSAMTVNAGATLDLADNSNQIGALNGGGNVTLGALAGTTLTIGGANSGSPGFTGTISGAGNVTHTNGTQVMTGCGNSYDGITTITGAFGGSVLSTDCIQNGGVNSGIGASDRDPGNLVLQNSGILNYTAVGTNQTTDRGFTLGAGFGYIQVSDPGTTLEFTGATVGPGSLIKRGAGTLILSGVSSSTGETRVEGGILRAGSATAFGTGSFTLSNVAGAVLDLNGFNMSASVLSGGGAAGGNVQLGSGTLTVGGANGTYAGLITGTGGFVKTGGGTQYLSGCNSNFTGGTSVTGGILQVQCLTNGGTNSSIGASSNAASNLVVNNGALTYLGAGSSTDRLMTIGGTAQILSSGTGAVDFTNTGAIVFANPNSAQIVRLGGTYLGDNRFGLRLDNNGAGVTSFIKQDAGTWILTNSGSGYTGTTQILGGVLGVDKLSNGGVGSSIGTSSNAASNLIIGSGSTLRYTGTGDSTDRRFTLATGTTFIESSGTGAVNFTNTGAVSYSGGGARVMALGGTNADDNVMGATIGNLNASNITSLAKNDSGKWILTGANSYTGATNVNAGTLIIGNGGTAGSIVSSTINVANGTALGFNRSDALTIGGTIQGQGAVQQLGAGTTVLTGTNSYTGGTTIAQGTLQLGNGGPTGSIVGDVVNNGTLTFNRNNAYGFSGTISGTGAVRQIGSGTTTLTGTNSYQGGTSITGGTLQVSSDANLGAASGGLTFNGGTLNTTASFTSGRATNLAGAGTFSTDAGTTLTLTGAVSGPGALTKTGTGALVLVADNNYTGGTTISAGTLQVGNGGATGSIAGNVLNNGALVVNRSGTLALGGTILGGGSFTQAGPGTTVLTGNNTYAGPTIVNSGTLLVNGNQAGATNLTSVASGATLGGTGTIGGSVTIADGGTLAAGSNGVGALTVNGNLALGNASQLNFEFGQANVPGGPLNDLVNVGGNLTLGGVVNVNQTSGGSFGPGVYRMFNYSGALTNNGLALGTMPPGSDVFVQTAIAGQVNLANTAGLTLNFWDGTGQPKNDGTIQGGDGTWVLGGGQNDWTEVNGAINADYAQDSFAIFQGASGTVTVDNGSGNVLTAGMQFAADGYTIAGAPLTLTGSDALIRTGDGSPADAGITTTITAELTGSARLVKDLGGTLVLTGTNSYTGGTAVNGGTLSISSDTNLGDAAGGLSLNGGVLNNTADINSTRVVDLAGSGTFLTDGSTTLTLNGVVSGAGALTKDGAGNLVLTADNAYAGGTTIVAGTLQLGNGGTSGAILGDVANDGIFAFNRSDSLTFAGAITGGGAVSQIGSGTTILTADNNYTGGTTISAGVLQLGAGGTTGGITGDVVNNAALIFNRSNEYSFAGLISGTGDVRQEGAGTTILTADNSYTGSTVISSGTLLINGNQTAANGTTNVLGGGALGGTGTIGGDVLVGGSATLTPGDATGPGTLTINGNLGFSPNAVLAYEFGQSDIVGGPLNDLVNVGGDLTLGGTLNVTTSGGGSFDPGIYRVINYGGTLTNNGLVIGTIPSGTDFYVQTSVANQVNLINTNGLALRFWDGAAGARNDGLITGGDGIWQNASGNDNWTLDDASINAPFLDSAFAIFGGAAGTISVDNGLGAVRASGMQFATDGYTITGQDLTLIGPQSVIRVGDGTAVGLGHTATIGSALIGNSQLVKSDLGTLVLSGTNNYTGGTRIDAGTLRISSDVNLGDAAGALTLNGGTLGTTATMSSNRAVDLLGAGTLLTDPGTTLTLGGTVSGTGGFTKAGVGDLVLTGANGFAGDVEVMAGSLFVNGDQSAAMGATNIALGATLGGSGIIGGNVAIADGATLAAGTNNVGTLTINGNLALGAGSVLDFEFGAANIAGGALNDLVNVGGDLTLDGTINVTVPAGGSFGPGIYRAFNYGGALSDNGLALGALPGGSSVSVQTAIAGQVNLVNTAGLTLSFWDGAAGPKNDGAVNGGDGVWRVGGGSNNWTSASGTPNADYAQDSFAIFSAAPGTVTIDNVGGNVLASGMQFASDGYRVTGDALTLTGTGAIVQVGDGSAASSGYTATIDAALTGAAQLVKTDAGTLVLAGTNTYAGGTAINGGTVRVSSDANLGDAAGGLSLDGGTLNTTADMASNRAVDLAGAGSFLADGGTTLTLNGVVSGAGALTKDGAGSLVLTADNGYAGGTTIAAGTLQLGNGGTSGSISGNVANNGVLAFNRADSLIFAGAITGNGAVNQIGTGTTILTANNNYTGGSTISAGVLQLGNGGTTGGITGDVVNNAALAFNRSDAVTYAGLISGTGTLTQVGSGTMVLTGANSYTGATSVDRGTLLVNGDQSAATGLTAVASGATLGGTGIIGGDVSVADGAALAPGAGGAGALTVKGVLSFAAGASLAYDFGLANAPGNPLNDVVHVGGDLTLDGTIDVAVTPGGAFDIGLYRVINYGGTLTDNGLAIGTMPAGSDVFVQTAVANQVNLINTGGAVLSFWDGAAGPKFDGAVNGGDGTWQNGTGNDNWTDASGAVNAPFDDDTFAIFTGAPGTVTIDNGLGAVIASGLQFAVDGYTVTGGDLTLTGPQSAIRVGDGTAAGTTYTATLASAITGSAQLVKTDAGTLVLTGANSYTGGTAINGGTLQIASDANLGAAAGGLSLNGGALNTTADLSSARAVDLTGAGTFLTDDGTTLTLTGTVSGTGGLTKSGAGTLILSGTGSHAGATDVAAGTLLVNGSFAGATGPTNVASGASLGGTGTIGGDVILAFGATLTPGAGGAGTLTIAGDLSLAAGTTLAWEFGAANVAGGALNDLVNVGGDLTLDGTIDVTVPAGGAFDVGVYRVFNYGGTLTDNGLGLGTLPAGSDVAVQTSIAGQVNLVNSAGLTLNFWDGAAGPKNNGVINGGTGTWQNSTGNDNWTDANGAVNAAYTDGAFAVFGGTGGTVTVDNGLGQVSAAGLQFAATGYTITGDGIALTGPQSTIRVGDGSTAGAGFTATINAALSGDTELVKTDAGTLVLGGTNSYIGGTRVTGGTVQIASDANLGAVSGAVTLDGGTLATSANVTSARNVVMAGAGTLATADGTTFTLGGLFSGTGALTKAGAGTLLVTGDSSGFAGTTTVSAGTLAVTGSLGGAVGVNSGARLEGTGAVGNLTNGGVVAPGRDGFGTLTVGGSYTGSGGTLEIEAALGGDSSQADRLVVTNGTSGTTAISVTNRGGLGAQTVEGIKIIDVTGGTSAGTFTLDGDYNFEGSPAVIAGAFGYRLFQGGVATPGDGDWYLRSALLDPQNEPQGPLYQPGVPLYESYAATLQTLNRLPTLQQRVGNRQWSGFTQGGVGMWGRIESTRHRPDAAFSTSGTDLDVDNWSLQAGFDKALVDNAEDTIIAGINGRYGTADARVRSRFGNGSIDTSGYGVGATLTWYESTGFYADAQAQVSWYRSDLESDILGTLADNNHGSGETFSLEVGKRASVGGGLSVTPQIQMIYSHVRFDSFVDPNDASVSSDRTGSLKTRWGISLDHQKSWDGSGGARRSHLYGIVNLSHEWLDGSIVGVSGTPLARRDERLWGEVGLGGSYSWNNDRFTLFAEISADTAIDDFGDSNNLRGNAGFRVSF
ncbi:autotransporter-associated beta strand repeat-containing protein [Sphingopyxis sp. JAI108]|uniref:autotransporter-associated beta strand repeat-containing protein n=1 Tax=Sphingopyxis sp. JAI108 TaxID=2723060 RepID=UPI0015C96366|nr:autotransporter-associated beta strand repeat-containing protein [Sphingopyxis sp. JAI108]NYF32621.1 fibronectin-binding autotransporter adhesin [Sphingopyxis sp. JAI108]